MTDDTPAPPSATPTTWREYFAAIHAATIARHLARVGLGECEAKLESLDAWAKAAAAFTGSNYDVDVSSERHRSDR